MIQAQHSPQPPGFHSVTVTGDMAGRIVTTVDLGPVDTPRYTVVPFEAEIAEGGGTKYMVVDAEKGGLGGGGVVFDRDAGGPPFTRDQARAERWAAELNAPIEPIQDVTADPQFLGEPPVLTAGACSHCPRRVHVLDGMVVGVRAFHRFDLSAAGGYYADELEAYQR